MTQNLTESPGGLKKLTIKVDKNTQYTLSTNMPKTTQYDDLFFIKTNEQIATGVSGVSVNNPRTVVSGDDGLIHIFFRDVGGLTNNSYKKFEDLTFWLMLNIGSVPSQYILSQLDLTRISIGLYRK